MACNVGENGPAFEGLFFSSGLEAHPEQLQDPVKVSEYLKEKCCGSSREMQSSAMCRALVTIYQTLLTILDSTLREKRSKAEQQALGSLKLQLQPQEQPMLVPVVPGEEIQAQTS